MTGFRALCADLLRELDHASSWDYQQALKDQARAALAQPEPEGPTDEEARELANYLGMTRGFYDHECGLHISCADLQGFARAVLARWGTPNLAETRRSLGDAPQPIPVSERLPGPEDCDAEKRCWAGTRESVDTSGDRDIDLPPSWELREVCAQDDVWLPAHALPVPADD